MFYCDKIQSKTVHYIKDRHLSEIEITKTGLTYSLVAANTSVSFGRWQQVEQNVAGLGV